MKEGNTKEIKISGLLNVATIKTVECAKHFEVMYTSNNSKLVYTELCSKFSDIKDAVKICGLLNVD